MLNRLLVTKDEECGKQVHVVKQKKWAHGCGERKGREKKEKGENKTNMI